MHMSAIFHVLFLKLKCVPELVAMFLNGSWTVHSDDDSCISHQFIEFSGNQTWVSGANFKIAGSFCLLILRIIRGGVNLMNAHRTLLYITICLPNFTSFPVALLSIEYPSPVSSSSHSLNGKFATWQIMESQLGQNREKSHMPIDTMLL